jgi:hypothetical protein
MFVPVCAAVPTNCLALAYAEQRLGVAGGVNVYGL